MIFMECQWITFDDWLFEEENETTRLAAELACALWVDRPKPRVHKPDPDYWWLPLYICSFGEEIIRVFGETLALYQCGELRHLTQIESSIELMDQSSARFGRLNKLNFYGVRNQLIRQEKIARGLI